MHTPKEHETETVSGRYVDLLDPDPKTIILTDIAHHLSQLCRYNGATRCFYSIAEHAVRCSQLGHRLGYGSKARLAMLHHDDAEYVLGDVIRPLKGAIGPLYRQLTAKMDAAIIQAIDLPWSDDRVYHNPDSVGRIDDLALVLEARQLLPSRGEGWGVYQTFNKAFNDGVPDGVEQLFSAIGLSQQGAEQLYLQEHITLTERVASHE